MTTELVNTKEYETLYSNFITNKTACVINCKNDVLTHFLEENFDSLTAAHKKTLLKAMIENLRPKPEKGRAKDKYIPFSDIKGILTNKLNSDNFKLAEMELILDYMETDVFENIMNGKSNAVRYEHIELGNCMLNASSVKKTQFIDQLVAIYEQNNIDVYKNELILPYVLYCFSKKIMTNIDNFKAVKIRETLKVFLHLVKSCKDKSVYKDDNGNTYLHILSVTTEGHLPIILATMVDSKIKSHLLNIYNKDEENVMYYATRDRNFINRLFIKLACDNFSINLFNSKDIKKIYMNFDIMSKEIVKEKDDKYCLNSVKLCDPMVLFASNYLTNNEDNIDKETIITDVMTNLKSDVEIKHFLNSK
jgi:hypothetical protein